MVPNQQLKTFGYFAIVYATNGSILSAFKQKLYFSFEIYFSR